MPSTRTAATTSPAGAGPRRRDRLLWSVVVVSGVIMLLTLIATQLLPPEPPPGGGSGRMLPRIPRVPPDAGTMLRMVGIGSMTWYACVLSAPLFFWLGRRLPLDRRRWVASLLVHLALVVVLVLVTALVQYLLTYAGAPMRPPARTFVTVALLTGSLPFLTVAAIAQALEARARGRDRELEAAHTRSQLAEARLEALTAQLQPHFLFNTLQGISALIPRDPAAADRMLTSLSDLLREVLRRGGTREVEVSEELRVLEPYLDISRTRFGERLSVSIDVTDDARPALVPFFILQPLVENALHHGVGTRAGSGRIGIRIWRSADSLHLAVSDDGPGVDYGAPPRGGGVGLANTRARLRELYGEAAELALVSRDGAGSTATVTLPYRVRTAAPEAGA